MGHTLADLESIGGQLSQKRSTTIFVQVCLVLEKAHRSGIVHGRLSAQSIVIADGDQVSITGWPDGQVAKALSQDELAYASPEVAAGGKAQPVSDTYAVGCLLYEALCGARPFAAGGNSRVLVPFARRRLDLSIDKNLEAITFKAMSADTAQRYASAAQLARDLEIHDRAAFLTGRNAFQELHHQRWRQPTFVVLALAAISCLLVAGTDSGSALALRTLTRHQLLSADLLFACAEAAIKDKKTESADLALQALASQPLPEASQHLRLARLCEERGNNKQALASYWQSGDHFAAAGLQREAIAAYGQGLVLASALPVGDRARQAQVLVSQAACYTACARGAVSQRAGDLEQARTALAQAAEICQSYTGSQINALPCLTTIFQHQADCCLALGENGQAAELYKLACDRIDRTKRSCWRAISACHRGYAAARLAEAQAFQQVGDMYSPLACYVDALKILDLHMPEESVDATRIRVLMAAYLAAHNRYVDADKEYSWVLGYIAYAPPGGACDLCWALSQRAASYMRQGKTADARNCLWQANEHARAKFGAASVAYADCQHELGTFYAQRHELAPAAAALAAAAAIYRRQGAQLASVLASTLESLAQVAFASGEIARQELALRECVALTQAAGQKDNWQLARSLEALYQCLVCQGKIEEARSFLDQSLAITEERDGNQVSQARQLVALGVAMATAGSFDSARQYYQRALAAIKRSSESGRAEEASTLALLASTYVSQKKYEQARPLLEQAQAMYAALGRHHQSERSRVEAILASCRAQLLER